MLSDTPQAEVLFISALPLVDRIVAAQARRHTLSGADRDDYAAWVKARLIDGDYAILRKFAGRSSLQTYLTAVLINLFRDYRNAAWGRWRPSAAAKRLGPTGVRIEELVYRYGHSVRETSEILAGTGAGLRDSEVARIVAALPSRALVREVSIDESEGGAKSIPDPAPPSDGIDAVAAIEGAVRRVVSELPPEDGLVLRMRFWDDMSVADIARALGVNQKALYRRIEAIQSRLRKELAAHGVDRSAVLEVLRGDFKW